MIEVDCAFATDTPGGPKISMMVATDSFMDRFLLLWHGEKVARMIM